MQTERGKLPSHVYRLSTHRRNMVKDNAWNGGDMDTGDRHKSLDMSPKKKEVI